MNNETPYTQHDLGDFSVISFDHEESDILGVGPKNTPFIDMEPYVDTCIFPILHKEIKSGLPRCKNLKFAKVEGELPPQFREDYADRQFEGKTFLTASKEDIEAMKGMNLQERRMYAFMFLNSIMPWAFAIYLRNSVFLEKHRATSSQTPWTQDAALFPELQNFIKTLPFESIGRVMFFCSYANIAVPPHRDFSIGRHKDHNINFFFDAPRKSYVYSSIKNEKTYLPSTRAYFFNNRDYHGVDAEPQFRYTLRVDGTFTKSLLQAIGISDGYVSS